MNSKVNIDADILDAKEKLVTSLCGVNTVDTLVSMLEQKVETIPDVVAFRFLSYSKGKESKKEITYAELQKEAKRVSVLIRNYASYGDRALLLYPPGISYYISFFACLYAGVIAVPAYPPSDERGLIKTKGIIGDCTPVVALTDKNMSDAVENSKELKATFRGLECLNTEQSLIGLEHQYEEKNVQSDTVAFLQYTSGSTGNPKGVVLTHSNLIANLVAMSTNLGLGSNDRYMTWLPPYHDLGLIGSLLLSVYCGMQATVMAPFDFIKSPIRWLRAISDYKATISGAPNFAYELCIRRCDNESIQDLDLSCWRTAYSGAEPIRPKTQRDFAARFNSIGFNANSLAPCYGLAESTLYVSGTKPGDGLTSLLIDAKSYANAKVEVVDESANEKDTLDIASCGGVDENYDIKIVDSDLNPCAENEVGEILLAGPCVSQGYWNRQLETDLAFGIELSGLNGKYLATGDLGFMHDGELYISGRKKDVIIYNGVNYYPQDIEFASEQSHVLLRPGCCACFLVEEEHGPGLVILQEVREGGEIEAESILQLIAKSITHKYPFPLHSVHLLKSGCLPKTSSGKICRQPAKKMYEGKLLDTVKVWSKNLRIESDNRGSK